MYVCNQFLCVCVFMDVCVCVLDGGRCVCVASRGSEWGETVFAWFAAGHTVHSGTVIFVP